MLDFDTTRLPETASEWQGLVDALVATDDYSETHYLEMKSALNMHAPAEFFKIPKFILGAANRMPDDAAPYFGGHALMVLGVKEGAADGLQDPLESKDIRARVEQYTGLDWIGWRAKYVPTPSAPERRVVIIVVDPPQWGDPIRLCHKRFSHRVRSTKRQGHCSDPKCPYPPEVEKILAEDGTVFCRPDSETRQARAKDIERLMERATTNKPAKLTVTFDGSALRIVADESAIHNYLHVWGQYFANQVHRSWRIDSGQFSDHFVEVWKWALEVEDAWEDLLDAIGVLGQEENQFRLAIGSHSNVSLRRPDITVRFNEEIYTASTFDVNIFSVTDVLPRPPRAIGKSGDISFGGDVSIASFSQHTGQRWGIVQILDEPDGIRLIAQMEDMRAYTTHKLLPSRFHLATTDPDVAEITGTWQLTAADHAHPPYQGEVRIPIVEVDVTQSLIRRLNYPPPLSS
ncbi:hypothetical protein [Nocardia salmonicida]|uniref:hypothetical protein n=1 Tax=Nocardia salmonicida TaxID=53431 RepID=UPI0033FF198D